jgi:hypothetical protein
MKQICQMLWCPLIKVHRDICWSHSWSWNWAHGGCDRSTGDAYSRSHLIPPLVFPGVHVSLIFTVLWIDLDMDFDCGFLPSARSDALILTASSAVHLIETHWFWLMAFVFKMGLTVGATGQQGMLTPPRHLIPPLAGPRVRVSPFIYLICNSFLCFETD